MPSGGGSRQKQSNRYHPTTWIRGGFSFPVQRARNLLAKMRLKPGVNANSQKAANDNTRAINSVNSVEYLNLPTGQKKRLDQTRRLNSVRSESLTRKDAQIATPPGQLEADFFAPMLPTKIH